MLGLMIKKIEIKNNGTFLQFECRSFNHDACDWHFNNAVLLIDWLPLTSAKNQTFIVRESHIMFKHEDSFITFLATKNERYFSKQSIYVKIPRMILLNS